ncbi:MAG: fibronectin type III domain-containing protein [Verrucomicrobia bacterium]|nr:fibronectin type III domain-containing protein [Verrucomicrobiota bacterium]
MANIYGEAVYGEDYYEAAGAPSGGGQKGRMAEIAFKFGKKTPADIRQLAVDAKAGLTNNPNFPNTTARVTALGTTIAAYDTAVTNQATAAAAQTTADDAVDTAVEAIKAELTGAKQDCEKVTRDPVLLGSSLMPLKGAPEPVGDLPAPADFSVTRSDAEGAVDGQCHKVAGAHNYKGEYAVNRDGPWQLGYEGTKSSFTQGGLTPGQVVYFRFAAFGPNGWSPWSDIAQCRVA